MNNILNLDCTEAREFLLEEKSYCNFDIPTYFKFSPLLKHISDKLTDKNITDFYEDGKTKPPSSFDDVNYKLFQNKDGEYAWRLFQLIHPALYVSLVHQITEKNNWRLIVKKFKEFQKGDVKCESLPVIEENQDEYARLPGFEENKRNNTKNQTFHWVRSVEQKSISLALEYNYIFHTDIVDCYGSIYTHSIAWALHTKARAKKFKNRNDRQLIGVYIDKSLQDMANGQTNGIPQGSILMDFIAEIVLGYADQELTKKITDLNKYQIIRYRDDYRIFVNNLETGKAIIKKLAESLSEIGMRLNAHKTTNSSDIINSSIKPDKLFWIENKTYSKDLQKQLLVLYQFSKKYPNSGTLVKELHNFLKNRTLRRDEEVNSLISILMNIAFRNPRIYPEAVAILSKFLELLPTNEKEVVIKKIQAKFKTLPNTEYLDLWLQRITLANLPRFEYKANLCKKVLNNSIEIWNSDWLEQNFKKDIFETKIIDEEEMKQINPVISIEEIDSFSY